jgi:hypothetical protein
VYETGMSHALITGRGLVNAQAGGSPTLLVQQGILTGGIGVDDTFVYFDGDTEALFKMPKIGGPIEEMGASVTPPSAGPSLLSGGGVSS